MMNRLMKVLLVLLLLCGASVTPCGWLSSCGLSSCGLSGAEANAASITLPKTGQTGCWDVSGNPVACTGTGQDGDKLKGAAWPSPRFVDQGNGSMLDNLTGLVWLKNADCFGTKTWQQALDSSNTLLGNNSQCSLNDGSTAGQWRLPNREEMYSLINFQQPDSYAWLNSQGFANTKFDFYWTATSYTPGAADKWIVHTVGGAYPESWFGAGAYSLIPVRDFTPAIGASPASKDFGSVTTSVTSSSQTFTLSNTGIDPLTVSSITLTGGDSGMFTLTVGDGTAGTCGATPTIAPAGSCTASATFTPSSTGAKSTTLRIASNDPATPNKDIAFSGTGTTPVVTYTVGTGAVGNGSVNCTPTTVNSGSTSSCTATATTPGNHISSVSGCGISYTSAGNADTIQVINTPTISGDCTVTGIFAINQYTVTFTTSGNGTLNGATSQSIGHGASTSAVNAVPGFGYHFAIWNGVNGAISGNTPLVINNVNSDMNITGVFIANPITLGSSEYATNRKIIATLSYPAATQMQFSLDNKKWTKWETYSVSKTIAVTAVNGTKTVYCRFKDGAGVISAVYSDTIILDTKAPKGKVVINNGDRITNSRSVSLTITASDATSGVMDMQFSEDGKVWSEWEGYLYARNFSLTMPNDGTKKIFVRFRDQAGKISTVCSDTIKLVTSVTTK